MFTSYWRRWLKRSEQALRAQSGGRKLPPSRFRPALESLEDRLAPATFIVDTTTDSGAGSLRDAILQANSAAFPGLDTINFAIPGAGVQTIVPVTPLPDITDALTIDGTSEPGFAGTPLIELTNAAVNSGSGTGLAVTAGNTTIKGLAINNFGTGIHLLGGGNNVIGGAGKDEGNVIAFNQQNGVLVTSGNGNAILGNAIFANGNLGIDLGGDGVTANDAGDLDNGTNGLQNFPLIDLAIASGSSLVIFGRLNSLPGGVYRLEFFDSAAADPTGFGEGQTFLGAITVDTDAAGDASFEANFAVALAAGHVITATATDLAGNSSEFSKGQFVAAADRLNAFKEDALVSDLDGDGVADPGDTLRYTITIINATGQDADSVFFADELDANTDLAVGSVTTTQGTVTSGNTPGDAAVSVDLVVIPANGTVTITFQATIDAALPATVVEVVNQGMVTSGEIVVPTDDPAAGGTDDPTVTPVPQADVAVIKTDSPDPVFADQDITYTVTVANNGPSDAQNVTFSDPLPANTSFIFGTSNQGTAVNFSNGVISADLGTIPIGGSITLTIVIHVDATASDGTIITNTATASTTTFENVPSNNSSTTRTTVQAVDLAVAKTDGPDPVIAGTNLTYTITVANNAVNTTASNVTFVDALPAGTTFVSFSAPAAWSVAAPSPGGSGTVTASAEILPAGASAQFTLIVRVASDVPQGTDIPNRANVTNAIVDSNLTNNSAAASTAVDTQAELTVAKSGPAVAKVRSLLTYTVTVSNLGPSDARNVVLTDVVPDRTIFVVQNQTSGPAFILFNSGNLISDTIATLPAGAGATFMIVALAPRPGRMVNTATVSSATADPQPGDNAAAAITLVGNQKQRWIAQVYLDLLQREVRSGELMRAEQLLKQPGNQRALRFQITRAILTGLEYRAKLIERFFSELLRRPPTPTDCAHFLDFLIHGGTIEQMRSILLDSVEYFEGLGGGTNAGWAAALFQDVLGRPITGPELAAVRDALSRGEPRESIAFRIISSTEGRVVRIRDYYNRFLRREPTTVELRNRLTQLRNGVRDEDIIASILASPEYFNNA